MISPGYEMSLKLHAWVRLFKYRALCWLIRDRIKAYRWTDVLAVYVAEHRRFYTEENVPTAINSIVEVVVEEVELLYQKEIRDAAK